MCAYMPLVEYLMKIILCCDYVQNSANVLFLSSSSVHNVCACVGACSAQRWLLERFVLGLCRVSLPSLFSGGKISKDFLSSFLLF